MTRRGYHQREHVRTSVQDRLFKAGSEPAQNELSMKDQVKMLGIDADRFQTDLFKLSDKMLDTCTLKLDYSSETLRKEIYPLLREMKSKYGIDIPIGLTGVDLPRLERRLDSMLEARK